MRAIKIIFPKVFFLSLYIFSFIAVSAQESHLKNIHQLTFGGDNAEAYFSYDGKNLSMQSNNAAWGLKCDQIFNIKIKKALRDTTYRPDMVSTGKGRTTCSFFLPDNKHILYASTHAGSPDCLEVPVIPGKYLWPVYDSYDIYVADLKGNIVKKLTDSPGYDAEATISPKGDKIVFTSTRGGDLDLWTMNLDGSDPKQVTFGLGYDGGAFFSPDGKKLVFRASRPQTEEDIKEYKDFLAQGLVAPTNMEIYTCNVDGSDLKQVTHLGKANWAPYFTPSGEKIIFSSNHHSPKGYDFQLWMVDLNGDNLEQITNTSVFNAFPMFSPDGKKIAFSSNRNNHGTHDTNVFIADWVE
ncbi:MAG: PD40 domain-containing protein [Bacteroidales bacterium]|nr:PD40 domain-containing protein [Bacteroidales bacterium]MCP5515570.1 PD40 domain-containing protein [Spirochaetales bacterium]